jgi:HlyD family secretion protein
MKGLKHMRRLKHNALLAITAAAVVGLCASAVNDAPRAQSAGEAAPVRQAWAASATGRVEPKNGLIAISTPTSGRIVDVAVKANDKVLAGDLLVRLEEDDLLTRVHAASVEVQVRERERDEEPVKGLALERRQAVDSVAAAERALYRARLLFDDRAFRARTSSTEVTPTDLEQARFQITSAKMQLANSRANLLRVEAKDGMPLSTRLESSLATARAELTLAEAAVERARIRATSDGTVLGVYAKYGELAGPSPEAPLIVMGDLSSLRVRAEVEERDAPKIREGQRVTVKGDAYPDKEFDGVVSSVSQSMAPPRIQPRGVRRPTDIDVIEVLIALDGKPPLLSGMRVDAFFRADSAAAAPVTATPTSSAAAGAVAPGTNPN